MQNALGFLLWFEEMRLWITAPPTAIKRTVDGLRFGS